MRKGGSTDRRGSILVLSLLVVTIGTLVGTSIIYYSGADRRAAEMGVKRVQARAMAWSGVQAVMAELAKQRDAMLAGDAPTVTDIWIAPAASGTSGTATSRWAFRVLPVGGKTVSSEMGKLDVNSAPVEVLAKLPGVGDEIAQRIVAAREKRRFTGVAELLTVPGITNEMLFGNGPAATTLDAASDAGTKTTDGASVVGGAGSGDGTESTGSLSRLVTVFSFDPEVQVGFGTKASDVAGKQRININAVWSEELGRAIEERFDKGIADGVKDLMEKGEKFEKPSSIVKKLRDLKVPPEDWVEVMDAFTTNPDQYRLGAVDLLTAPVGVLKCVPGITPDAAEEIVARREKLDSARRGTVAWPVLEGIVKPEEFEQAVDFLTSRSLQWRVVIEGGILPESVDGVAAEKGPDWEPSADAISGDIGAQPAPLRDRVVLEAVIDVASLRARVAYLRDVTFIPTARTLASAAKAKDRELGDDQRANIAEEINKGNPAESLPDAFHTELNMPGLDIDPGTKEDGSRELELAKLGSNADAPADPGEAGDHEKDGTGPSRAEPEGPPPSLDRRLGRWTTGSGGPR